MYQWMHATSGPLELPTNYTNQPTPRLYLPGSPFPISHTPVLMYSIIIPYYVLRIFYLILLFPNQPWKFSNPVTTPT